jgi:hypothetical protein
MQMRGPGKVGPEASMHSFAVLVASLVFAQANDLPVEASDGEPRVQISGSESESDAVQAALRKLSAERRQAEAVREAPAQQKAHPNQGQARPHVQRPVTARRDSKPAKAHDSPPAQVGLPPPPLVEPEWAPAPETAVAAPGPQVAVPDRILVVPSVPTDVPLPSTDWKPAPVAMEKPAAAVEKSATGEPVVWTRRWWLWVGVGAVVAGAAAATAIALRSTGSSRDPSLGSVQGNPP